MEQPKQGQFNKEVVPVEPDEVSDAYDKEAIDTLAKRGHYKEGDLPGTDTYDDGMNQKGEVIMPGSTSTGSGGIYMEERGPNDLIRRGGEEDVARAEEAGLNVSDDAGETAENNIYAGDDPAAKWLRENDKRFKDGKGLSGAL